MSYSKIFRNPVYIIYFIDIEAYLEASWTTTMELLAINRFRKRLSLLDVQLDCKYLSIADIDRNDDKSIESY